MSRFYGTVEWNSGIVEWWNEFIFNEGNDGQDMKLYFILAGDLKPAAAWKVTSELATA